MMDCKECLPLIPGYVDQELSEVQSAPLRQHLMDCQECRKALAGQKSLERWFASPLAGQAEVPDGFAQRVARRAFAGDLGRSGADAGELQPAAAAMGNETPIYSFVLWATAAAAGLLLVVSGMLFQEHLGDSDSMHAGVTRSVDEILDSADELSDPALTANPAPSGEPGGRSPGALEDMSDMTTKKTVEDQLQDPKH